MRYRSIRRREKEPLAKPAAPPQGQAPASAARETGAAASLLGLSRTHANSYVRGLLARRAAPAVMRQATPGEEKDKKPAAETATTPPKADEKKAKKPETKQGKTDVKKEKPLPDPINVILKDHPALIKWKDGFFTLEWELVKELHANGFRWGATFPHSVDLHHFELTD